MMPSARTRKRRTDAASLAWSRMPIWHGVHIGRFRNSAAPDRRPRPRPKPFCVIFHADDTMTRLY